MSRFIKGQRGQLELIADCLDDFFLNGPTPASFSFIFGLFKQTLQFLQYVKNVHPVYGAGIRTHDLQNVSLFPLPLDQGSRPDDLFLDLLLRRVFVRDFLTFKKIPEQRKKTNWREFLGRLPLLNHLQKS